jgi:hypothetical protein
VIYIYSEPSRNFALFSGDAVKDPAPFGKQDGDAKYREYLFRPSNKTAWLAERTEGAMPGPSDLRLVAVDEAGREFLRELCSVSGKLGLEDGCNLIFTLIDPGARADQVAAQLAAPSDSMEVAALPPDAAAVLERPSPKAEPAVKEQPRGGLPSLLSLLFAALAGALVMFLVWMAVDRMRPHQPPFRIHPVEGRRPR